MRVKKSERTENFAKIVRHFVCIKIERCTCLSNRDAIRYSVGGAHTKPLTEFSEISTKRTMKRLLFAWNVSTESNDCVSVKIVANFISTKFWIVYIYVTIFLQMNFTTISMLLNLHRVRL